MWKRAVPRMLAVGPFDQFIGPWDPQASLG